VDNFMNFMQLQWGNIVVLLGLILSAGVVVAKWTPTPKDDAWFARLLSWLNLLPHGAKAALKK